MARFAQNDSISEGRQYDGTNITKLARWLGATWNYTILDNQEVLVDTEEGDAILKPSDWIMYDEPNKVVMVYTEKEVEEGFKMVTIHKGSDGSPRIDPKKIENRFGHHKATIEGPNATAPKHENLRAMWTEFASKLENELPDGRYKSLAMTELENASMWSHKSVAELSV